MAPEIALLTRHRLLRRLLLPAAGVLALVAMRSPQPDETAGSGDRGRG